MGDADQRSVEEGINVESDFIRNLDGNLLHLQSSLTDLEDLTLRAVGMQLKGYEDFRLIFMAINFALLPVILAIGITLALRDVITTDSSQVMLHTTVSILLFLSGTFGVPLYFVALWAMYRFSIPDDLYSENFIGFEDDLPSLYINPHYSEVDLNLNSNEAMEFEKDLIEDESVEVENISNVNQVEKAKNPSETFAKGSDDDLNGNILDPDNTVEYPLAEAGPILKKKPEIE